MDAVSISSSLTTLTCYGCRRRLTSLSSWWFIFCTLFTLQSNLFYRTVDNTYCSACTSISRAFILLKNFLTIGTVHLCHYRARQWSLIQIHVRWNLYWLDMLSVPDCFWDGYGYVPGFLLSNLTRACESPENYIYICRLITNQWSVKAVFHALIIIEPSWLFTVGNYGTIVFSLW